MTIYDSLLPVNERYTYIYIAAYACVLNISLLL